MSFSVSSSPRFAGLSLQAFSRAENGLPQSSDDDDYLNPYDFYTVKATGKDRQTYKDLFTTSNTLTFGFGADCNSLMVLTHISTEKNGKPNTLPQTRDQRNEAVKQVRALFTQLLPEVQKLKVPAELAFLIDTKDIVVKRLQWLIKKMC